MSHPLVRNKGRGESFDVYVGRPTKWGNPFVIGIDGSRPTVIRKYRAWASARFTAEDLEPLRGKTLGCWCAPRDCHAEVLIELLAHRL